jgi:beta-phosphoglucomutase-like phosphatase (HAD superfamily)
MTIRAIAWDIDGTLVDSEPVHHHALLAASLRWNADLSDLPAQAFSGVHMHDVWTALAGRFPADLDRAKWLAAIDAHYAKLAGSLVPLVGAVEAIRAFAGRGLRQVCVSNSNRRIVDTNLRILGIAPFIAFSVSFDDVDNGKPHPEPYRTACERLGLAPATVLAVEDSATGIRSARSAGLKVAAYAPGAEGFVGADMAVSHFDQLVAWVDGCPPSVH